MFTHLMRFTDAKFSLFLGYHLCEAVVKAVKDKPLRIYCLLQALRMTENQKRELSLVDCIFMERSYSDHYYDIALPYAKRPIFGIVSTEIDSKHIAEYFLNSARICSKCGDYEAALLQAKLVCERFAFFPFISFSFRVYPHMKRVTKNISI